MTPSTLEEELMRCPAASGGGGGNFAAMVKAATTVGVTLAPGGINTNRTMDDGSTASNRLCLLSVQFIDNGGMPDEMYRRFTAFRSELVRWWNEQLSLQQRTAAGVIEQQLQQ